jgi:NTE family protein
MAASAYAAGHSPEKLEEYMTKVDQRSFFGFHFGDDPGLLGISGVAKAMGDLLGDITFSELKIPCALTAVDLDSGQEMILSKGRVLDAVLATIAIPGIFPPKRWGDRLLVDGGVLDPVPVSVVREISPVKYLPVVAVTLTSSPTVRGHLPALGPKGTEVILNRIARLKVAKALEIFLHSIEIGTSSITEIRLQLDKPEVIIRPSVGHIGYLDQVKVSEVVRLGEVATGKVLPELHKVVSLRGRLSRLIKRY